MASSNITQVVSLVNNQDLMRRQDIVLCCHIANQERVVDYQDIGLVRVRTRLKHETWRTLARVTAAHRGRRTAFRRNPTENPRVPSQRQLRAVTSLRIAEPVETLRKHPRL